MTKLQVARYMLDNGLPNMDGVVYLDDADRQMVLVRQAGVGGGGDKDGKQHQQQRYRIMKLSECGLSEARRFTFYVSQLAVCKY